MDQQGITTPGLDGVVGPLGPMRAQGPRYAPGAAAAATRTAHRLDWACFAAWTATHGLDARPAQPETVGLYLTAMAATLKVSTLERRLAAIAIAHRLADHQLDTRHPAIRDVLRGIRRAHGSARRPAPGSRG